jgi:hypothetical protein
MQRDYVILLLEEKNMDETILTQSKPKTADYKAALEHLFQEIDQSDQKMQTDRRTIEQLKAEADTLKAETRAILTAMGATF